MAEIFSGSGPCPHFLGFGRSSSPVPGVPHYTAERKSTANDKTVMLVFDTCPGVERARVKSKTNKSINQ